MLPKIQIEDNYEKILVLDGERFGISFPTESIYQKFRQIMKQKYSHLLMPNSGITDSATQHIIEPRSIGSSYIANIVHNEDGLFFNIKSDMNCLYESGYQTEIAHKTIAEIAQSTSCYQTVQEGQYVIDPLWRPVLIPLTKDGRRDMRGIETDGTITKGLTMYYEDITTKKFIPAKQYELHHKEVVWNTIRVCETHDDPQYAMTWMWVDGVLISLYTQGTDEIGTFAEQGFLFSKFLLDE